MIWGEDRDMIWGDNQKMIWEDDINKIGEERVIIQRDDKNMIRGIKINWGFGHLPKSNFKSS